MQTGTQKVSRIRGRTSQRHRKALSRDTTAALLRLNRTIQKKTSDLESTKSKKDADETYHSLSRDDPDLLQSKELAQTALYEARRRTQFNKSQKVANTSSHRNEEEANSQRRKSLRDKLKSAQQKILGSSGLVSGGLKHRESLRVEAKPFTTQQRLDIVRKVDCLSVLSDANKKKFAENLLSRVYGKGDEIIVEGDVGDEFYILEKGKVLITRVDLIQQSKQKELARLGPTDFFGEIALLVDAPRTATAKCLETCTVLYATKKMFESFCGGMETDIIDNTKDGRVTEILNATLEKVSLFDSLTKLQKQKLVAVMGRATYRDGEYLCREGEIGNVMFILLKGEVKILKDEEGNKKEVFRYHRFEYFGELALINADSKRTADCVAVGNVEVLYLHRIHFNSLPSLAAEIGLKDMFVGFGSRKNIIAESAELLNGRRRQSFVMKYDPASPRNEDEESENNLDESLEFAKRSLGRNRSDSVSSVGSNGSNGDAGGRKFSHIKGLFKKKVKGMIQKSRNESFMRMVHDGEEDANNMQRLSPLRFL